jgi:predicted aldo/keto reductase-like oxidoreductase
MQYRKFGKLGWKSSALGFGAMPLPIINKDPGNVDESESIRIIRYAIDQGVNYVDTAYPYHNFKAEPVLGKALLDGYRQKVKLATKLSSFVYKDASDMERIFREQLNNLQTEKIDFYVLYGLNATAWSKLQEWKVFEWGEQREDRSSGFLISRQL